MIAKKVKNSAFYCSASSVSNHRTGKLRKSIVISFTCPQCFELFCDYEACDGKMTYLWLREQLFMTFFFKPKYSCK